MRKVLTKLKEYYYIRKKLNTVCSLVLSSHWSQDLLRTMPTNACFSHATSTGVPRLRRILRGLAWLYPDIGYCQGTSMVSLWRSTLPSSACILRSVAGFPWESSFSRAARAISLAGFHYNATLKIRCDVDHIRRGPLGQICRAVSDVCLSCNMC